MLVNSLKYVTNKPPKTLFGINNVFDLQTFKNTKVRKILR